MNESSATPDRPEDAFELNRFIGSLLVTQSTLAALPDEYSTVAFTGEMLDDLHGSATINTCYRGTPVSDRPPDVCRTCQAFDAGSPDDIHCPRSVHPNVRTFPLRTTERHFGFLIAQIDDSERFAWLEPYLHNFCQTVAVTLENKEILRLLQRNQAELESRVAARTQDLAKANERLERDNRARRRAESHARALFEQAAVGMVVLDDAGTIRDVNSRYAGMMGRRADELTGRPFTLFADAEDPTEIDPAAHGIVRREHACERADGTVIHCHTTLSPLVGTNDAASMLAVIEDVTERNRAREELSYLAYHDALTGLANRALLEEHAQKVFAHVQRTGRCAAVLFIDIDHFKLVNDSMGHDRGDVLLRRVSRRLEAMLRADDTVARLGGDEFVVLLSDLNRSEDARLVASKLLEAIAVPTLIDAQEIVPTASIGIAIHPDDGTDLGTLLKHADTGLYEAKRLGRNRASLCPSEASTRMMERVQLETALRHAVQERAFRLDYQPQFDLASGRITGMEALLRWEHPTEGVVSPERFIPVLEETRLIAGLTGWILDRACHQACAWQEQGSRPVEVAVNVSAGQLQDESLIDQIRDALAYSGLEPELLCIEVTESIVMSQVDASTDILSRIKALGVRIAVDDFGTGYSSLAYINTLPLDALKIDKSFVTHLSERTTEQDIAAAIIALAHAVGINVVAEGIESAEQLRILRQLGCDQGQGYYRARPMPAPEADAFLAGALTD